MAVFLPLIAPNYMYGPQKLILLGESQITVNCNALSDEITNAFII